LKKLAMSMVLAAGLALPGWVVAATAAKDELKIGFVDGTRLSQEAPQAKAASDRLAKEFEPRKNEIVKAQEQMRDREERFVKESAFMSAADKQKKERELATAQRELRSKQNEFQEDLTIRRNEELAKVMDSLRTAIQEYGKAEGYDLILFEGVSYASERVNLTDEVLKKLKAK
jgi:outer membrane protein